LGDAKGRKGPSRGVDAPSAEPAAPAAPVIATRRVAAGWMHCVRRGSDAAQSSAHASGRGSEARMAKTATLAVHYVAERETLA
jgi:hypothetical protein